MKRSFVDGAFFVVAFLVVAATVVYMPSTPVGKAAEQPDLLQPDPLVPHVELLAPDKRADIYSPSQSFLYRIKSVDYEVDCSLYIDNDLVDTKRLGPDHLATVRTNLDIGIYSWKVECKLLNGRTISSTERTLRVLPYQEMAEAFQVTGNVVSVPARDESYRKSLVLGLALLASLVWIAKTKN